MCWKVSFPKGMTYVTSSASSVDLPQTTVPSLQRHFSKQEGPRQQTICKEATGGPQCAQQVPVGEGSPDLLPCLTTWQYRAQLQAQQLLALRGFSCLSQALPGFFSASLHYKQLSNDFPPDVTHRPPAIGEGG